MRYHIVGAGPAGISLAWMLSRSKQEVHLYTDSTLVGGSWTERDPLVRDLHAWRMVFRNASPNVVSLFRSMAMRWEDYFHADAGGSLLPLLARAALPRDYLAVIALYAKVCLCGMYRATSARDALREHGASRPFVAAIDLLCLHIDGVRSDVMTCHELFSAIDHVALSTGETQNGSGHRMCKDMERALLDSGVEIHYTTRLSSVDLSNGTLDFSGGLTVNTNADVAVLCVDAGALHSLTHGQMYVPTRGTYGSISVVFRFDAAVELRDHARLLGCDWAPIVASLPDGYAINAVLCDTGAVSSAGLAAGTTPERVLIAELWRQLVEVVDLPPYVDAYVCWGSEWDAEAGKWTHVQTANVITGEGYVPHHIGKNIYTCCLLNERDTPYASMEAAVEISRRVYGVLGYNRRQFRPLRAIRLSNVIVVVIAALLATCLLGPSSLRR